MALLLLALLPLALPWGLVCFGGLAVMLFTRAFPCVGLPRMGSLLAALPEVRLPGMGCWCTFRVPQLLCLVPLRGCSRISGFWYSSTGVAPGIIPSSWHGFLPGARSVFVRWGSVGLLRTSDVRVFLSECTLRPGLGLD